MRAAQSALAPVPEATKAANATVAKAPAPKIAKQALGKVTEPAPDATLAMAPTNQVASTTLRSPPRANAVHLGLCRRSREGGNLVSCDGRRWTPAPRLPHSRAGFAGATKIAK